MTAQLIATAIYLSQGGSEVPERLRYEWAEVIEDASLIHDVDPLLIVSVVAHESKWDATAVLPGCPRQGPKPRWCNRDGYPDVGLCQLHINPRWQRLSKAEALDPESNLERCAEELAEARRIHDARGCARKRHAARRRRYPWTAHRSHHWIHHVNLLSERYGPRILARRARLSRRLELGYRV